MKTIFWNVDTQYDFMRDDSSFKGALAVPGAKSIEKNLKKLTDFARENEYQIVNTADYMTEEVMDLMIERETYFVPTIMAGNWVAEKAAIDGFFPELVRPKAAAIGPIIADTFAKAYRRGVPIVFGTDTGVSAHGDNAIEFALMVEGGMPEMEAIQSATSVAADFLDIGDTHGRIKEGYQADIVAVRGNPLDDITLLQNVSFVMKGGTIYK